MPNTCLVNNFMLNSNVAISNITIIENKIPDATGLV